MDFDLNVVLFRPVSPFIFAHETHTYVSCKFLVYDYKTEVMILRFLFINNYNFFIWFSTELLISLIFFFHLILNKNSKEKLMMW